jgi:hypothetical protein
MDRVLRNASAVLTVTLSVDGAPADPSPDSATVVLVNTVGTELYNGLASDDGTGVFSLPLTPAMTASLDTLTAVWTMVYGSETQILTTTAEIVGGFLFTVAEARALSPLDNTTNFSTADIIATRTAVEQAIEQAAGVAFAPRYALESYSGDGSWSLMLRRPLPSAVRSVTIGGAAVAAGTLTGLALSTSGELYSTALAWTYGRSNILIGYEHGFGEAPHEIKRAALLLAKMWLTERRSPIDDRAITFNAGADGGTYSLAVPGRNGSHFGHPDVDAAIDRYALVTGIA